MSEKNHELDEILWSAAQRKGISRNDFLKLLASGGIVTFLAACYPEALQMTPNGAIKPTQTQVSPTPTPSPKSIPQRINDRLFPSTFMAWNQAINLTSGFIVDGSHYDLAFTNEWKFELQWKTPYPGEGVSFIQETLERGRAIHASLLHDNPNFLVLASVNFYDASPDWLPEDSLEWARDSSGKHLLSSYSNFYKLNWHTPTARTRVVAQAEAFIESGIFDGIMLDEWDDNDPDRIKILNDVRSAIGDDKLIMINNNARKAPNSAPYVNGLYMESLFWSNQLNTALPPLTPDDWQTISDTLLWAEASLREPHINALETRSEETPIELNRLRATTTLALTHSKGYMHFLTREELPIWDPFWDHKELGRPVNEMTKRPDGAIQREYEGGTVIYNPMGNTAITITFAEPRLSAANGQTALTFVVEDMDGDIYLKTS